MKVARLAFGTAAAYGFIVILPMYFLLEKVDSETPPAVTHPEFYYGFLGLALLWQCVFALIAKDPIRFRSIMPVAIGEKFVYTILVMLLYAQGRVQPTVFRWSLVDPIFGMLFVSAYFATREVARGNQR